MLGALCMLACTNHDKTTILPKNKVDTHHVKLIPNAYNVGFLIMDGVYNTELTAPYDIF